MFGSIIGAIGSLAGGLLGGKSQEKAADSNAALQREFAQQGVRWKVEDAKAAGIHPLYALGANTIAASPSYVGGSDYGIGNAMAGIGQDISRSIDAKRTQRERDEARLQSIIQADLTNENMGLQNDLLRAQIAKIQQPAHPPAMPTAEGYTIDGQGNSRITTVPLERTASAPGIPAIESGAINDVGYAHTVGGGLAPVPSNDVKQRIEDTLIPEMHWNMRNLVMPYFGGGQPPPQSALPAGYSKWYWDHPTGEWRPTRQTGFGSNVWWLNRLRDR